MVRYRWCPAAGDLLVVEVVDDSLVPQISIKLVVKSRSPTQLEPIAVMLCHVLHSSRPALLAGTSDELGCLAQRTLVRCRWRLVLEV